MLVSNHATIRSSAFITQQVFLKWTKTRATTGIFSRRYPVSVIARIALQVVHSNSLSVLTTNRENQPKVDNLFDESNGEKSIVTDDETIRLMEEREELLHEARCIALSFWRSCIRCTRLMRRGNDNDEKEFQRKEEEQFDSTSISFGPPVDRENELRSRADYYLDWASETIFQESDCLDDNPWLEENVDRYLHFIRLGEERRQWILNAYKFPDPYPNSFDHERINRFESRAKALVQKTYEAKGWRLNKGHTAEKDKFWEEDNDIGEFLDK